MSQISKFTVMNLVSVRNNPLETVEMILRSIPWFIVLFCSSCAADYFVSTPPEDYGNRSNLSDCQERFYPDLDKYSEHSTYGGAPASRGEFQHMVAIGWLTETGISYLCGGSLITSTFVLTAAHCAFDSNGNRPVTARLGDIDVSNAEDDQFAQQIPIKRFIKHPMYRAFKHYYDVALVELEREAEFSEAVCPACLWMEQNVPPEPLTAIGFGRLGFAGELSPTLQKVQLPVINETECSSRLSLPLRSLPRGIVSEQFCAASPAMDTCEGDSGGPIQTERVDVDRSIIPLIVGVVSFGTPCTAGSTGIYSRVASYKSWIEQVTGQLFDHLACTRGSKCRNRKKIAAYYGVNILTPPQQPYHRVALLWSSSDTDKFRCGGTLVDYRHVLTSAYCATKLQGPPKFIAVESTDEIVPIEDIAVHPGFSDTRPQFDLALLRLSKYLKADSDLLPACLWRESRIKEPLNLMYYSAYSARFEDDKLKSLANPNERCVVMTAIGDNGKCVEEKLQEADMLCSKNENQLIPGVCKMDVGGPVTNLNSIKFLPQLFGVVSPLSQGCENPVTAVRVASNLDWIENTILGQSHP
ncbi:uncharacterized protein LOC129754306 [Uranotaenia lowii]|uniref:uncharacterized protein LOC129754306 n=1 Tax=Uranotaenia lowii TaxID=190385 RepID=UPI00247A8918|nr:uncharacterized protein LOC129754306 [Uranotaenia lowii]